MSDNLSFSFAPPAQARLFPTVIEPATNDALRLMLSATRAQANGHDRAGELLDACSLIEREFLTRAKP